MENRKQFLLPPPKKGGIMAVSILQIMLIKERKIPLTGFGWFDYLRSEEGQKRLKELEVKKNNYEKTLE